MNDPYSRVDYRRLIAWPERIRREAPFLRDVLRTAPEASVVDLGCGTGEHSRFFASEDFRTVGIDSSDSMLEKAMETPTPSGLRFVSCNIQDVGEELEERFGAAVCLGNTLVHLTEEDDLRRAFKAVATVLVERGLLLFQVLNYERIFARNVRYLPLNFRTSKGDHETTVFLRLMEPLDDGRVRFCPTTLRYDPDADPPLHVVQSRIVELRGWKRGELTTHLAASGFAVEGVYGDMERGDYEAEESQDLVMIARRR